MLREWIVTLHNKEDLEDFYNDMETPGGNLYIPDRAVDLVNRREISRNTHYMLTDEEVEEVKKDPRVWGCDLRELVDNTTKPCGYSLTNADFEKSWLSAAATDINWGLLRETEVDNRTNWGDNGTSLVSANLTITASGKNVDVLIVDGHIDPDHPEFAVNSDGSGGSRVVQYNWFQNNVGSGTGTYTYDRSGSYTNALDADDNDHGCHCAGTVAGNTQGWARDANIYNISPYGSNPNWGNVGYGSSTMWDYIRAWHNSKPINSATGRRNPTISNNSYGSSIISNYSGSYTTGAITRINYRGVDFNPGRDLTVAELEARGCYTNASTTMSIPNYFTSREADIQDAIDDGIIIVASAGNDSWKIVNSNDQDYNNYFEMVYQGVNFAWYLHRGTGSGAGYAPVITVGAVCNNTTEEKATFSNCGSQVDVYAAGEAINSSLHRASSGGAGSGVNDPRNASYAIGKYQGTSMSGPQVAGILALLAESWPNMNQEEAHAWIVDNANDNKMYDTNTDDPTDRVSLQFGDNKYARWINQRQIDGNNFPQRNFAVRPTSGTAYPRPRIRRRG